MKGKKKYELKTSNLSPTQIQIIENGKSLLMDIQTQLHSMNSQIDYGIISKIDAANEFEVIKRKEYKIKKEMVFAVHVKNDGQPRKITYQESKGLWYTILADKSKLYAKSEEELIDKLFVLYDLSITDYSIEGIFKLALKEKSLTDNNNPLTIESYEIDYNRFIDSSIATKDIRHITKTDLKMYTQELVNQKHPDKKAFFKYKSVLNLIFRYALEYDIISSNPVDGIRNSIYYKSCSTTNVKPEDKILSKDEIEQVKKKVRKYMQYPKYNGYFINGYAILLAIETGMRAGEIPSLKWEDVGDEYLHIHSQQLAKKRSGGKDYYYAGWTKNERGVSNGGRLYPLTDNIKNILSELKELQDSLNIKSEYIFCHEDGEWIKTDAYETCLRRMLKSLGFNVTNNHAFRMSLNSNIFIPLNIPVTERARLLGHSIETNLKYYSFAEKDSLNGICSLLNSQVSPRSHLKAVI